MKSKVLYNFGILVLTLVFVIQGFSADSLAVGDGVPASADTTVDIDVEKVWQDANDADQKRPSSIDVDLKNGDTVVQTVTITPDDKGDWKGVFEDVPRFDDQGNEIQYTVEEQPVDGYDTSIEQGPTVSEYDYPTNISDVELEPKKNIEPTSDVSGSSKWKIQPGLTTDYIEGTQVVFNTDKLTINKAIIQEFDKDGNTVPKEDRRFYKANSKTDVTDRGDSSNNKFINYKPKDEDLDTTVTGKNVGNGVYKTDHVLQLTFNDGVTVLDGTATGSKLPVVITVSNFSVVKSNTNKVSNVLSSGFWASSYTIIGTMMDINLKVTGLTDGSDVLLSFVDVDVTGGSKYQVTGETDRKESVYLVEGFDSTFYTVPLTKTSQVQYTGFEEASDGSMRAYAVGQDKPSTLGSGFVTRGRLDQDGFTLRWTGADCATSFFDQVKPFKLKVTVDENTASASGGSITEQGEWKYRDYGEDKVITVTPDEGYHVKYLKLDGAEIDLDQFDENGYMEVETGYTVTNQELNPGTINLGTEKLKLYQRADGVIDIYLPAQYYSDETYKAPARVDHWIDTSFETNGLAENYVITNTQLTEVSGTKTWVAGKEEHLDNKDLTFNLKQKLSTQTDDEAVDYPYDRSQITWEDNKFTISGLPAYDADGNEYEYLLSEVKPAGYDVTQNGNDLINTLKQEIVTVQGKKTWRDGGKTHNNAEEVIVKLYRATWDPELKKYGSAEEQTATPTWTGDTYKFENLPKYDDARFEYKYTVTESVADSINTDPSKGDYYECVPDSTGRNFVNTLKGATTFSGTKTWLDGDKDHNNAEDVSLVLMRRSSPTANWTQASSTVSWNGNTYTYTNLDKYDSNGNEYTYSVRENRVMGKQANAADYDIYYDGEFWDYSSFDPPSAAYQVTGTDITNALKGTIAVHKRWNDENNRDGKRPDKVTVHLKKGSEEIESAELDSGNQWSHTFSNLSLYELNGSTIEYSLTEDPVKDDDGNILYTTTVGDLLWNEDKTGYTVEVTNSREIDKIDIPVEKKWIDGDDADGLRPDSVIVQLFADGQPVEGETLTLSKNDDPEKNWKGTFTDLPKNQSGEVGKPITYSIKEVDENGESTVPSGYTDSYSTVSGVLTVTNTHVTYTKAKLEGYKKLTGRDMSAEEFQFKLEAADDATKKAVTDGDIVLPSGKALSPAAADGIEGKFEFGDIVFKKDGKYEFKVTEDPSSADPPNGITYDTHAEKVTIEVKVDDNALVVESITISGGKRIRFENTYSASGDYTPAGEKTLTGQSDTPDETAPDADPPKKAPAADTGNENSTPAVKAAPAEGAKEDAPQSAAADESVPAAESADAQTEAAAPSDDESSAPAEDLNAENGDAKTAAADKPEAEDTDAKTAEAAEGDEVAAPAEGDEDAAPAENDGDAEAEDIEAVKSDAKTASQGDEVAMAMTKGQFKFEIRYSGGSEFKDKVASKGENEAAEAGETAAITFGKMSYDTALLKQLAADGAATRDGDGKYHISYYVVETQPTEDCFQHNTTVESFEAVITDDGKGHLSVEIDPKSATNISFTNRYVTDTATVALDGLKVLSTAKGSRPLKEGDFEFTVECVDGAPAPEKTSVKNDAGGAVSFGDIVFTKGDIGDNQEKTFTYKITEKNDGRSGMSYDGETRTVTVTVTDDGKGHLTTATDPESAPLFTFTNSYEPDPVSETVNKDITVTKILKGADLTAGQFSFRIQAADDETKAAVEAGDVVMPSSITETNGADGSVAFDKITYNKIGKYTFRISEVIPDGAVKKDGKYELNGILYDAAEYTAVVVVGDDENGKLVIDSQKLSDGSSKAIYVNEKILEKTDDPAEPDEPEEPDDDDDEPDKKGGTRTGDDTNLAGWLALLIAGGAGAGEAIVYRRRRRDD